MLAGAFLLRALTDSGQLPATAGVWAGLTYAAVWLALAARTRGRSSLVHGLASLMIALPLVVEAASRFRVFPPGLAATVLASFALAVLAVSASRRLSALALAAVLGAMATALAVAIAVDAFLPSTLAILAVAAAAFWIGDARGWAALAWPSAAGADLAAAVIAVRASAAPPRDAPLAAEAIQAALIVLYLGSTMVRVLMQDKAIRAFDVAQTVLVLLVGLGGAVAIAQTQQMGVAGIGIPCLLAGAVMYGQAFTTAAERHGLGREFYYFGMTALALVLVGIALVVPSPAKAVVIAAAALGASVIAWRLGHPMLALQGAIAAVTASAVSGLVGFTARAWLAEIAEWPAADLAVWFVLAAVAAALLLPRAEQARGASGPSGAAPALIVSIARAALIIAFASGVASLLIAYGGRLITGTPADMGRLATLRSVILAGAAAVLALASRLPRFSEAAWIAYGALVGGAVKILAEDFPQSRPSTLFLALAAYGAALIYVPKILKRTEISVPPPQRTSQA